MTIEEIMEMLDIESQEDFMYFEQFAALMETEADIDYDTFAELLLLMDLEALQDVVQSFFEDMIKGVPDDNTQLYASLQTIKDTLLSLAGLGRGRNFGFLADELFHFRQWYLTPGIAVCQPENGGAQKRLSPCEALMLYREEKLSGTKYSYDFSQAMPEEPDEYVLDLIAEMTEDYDRDMDRRDMLDMLPDEYDPDVYDPDSEVSDSPIDPYRDGFVDRRDPVIEGEGYDVYEN